MIQRRAGERQEQLLKVVELRKAGFDENAVAEAVGVHRTTVKRWLGRQERGQALTQPRGPLRGEGLPNMRWRAESLVRELRGLVGAESLRRSVPGLSRREAARIKAETLRDMERERREEADRIHVTSPGVLRGFDAMDVGQESLLIAGDASVPYRTSWSLSERYDSAAVLELLERDFAQRGAPLVLRMDRAKQHQTDELRDFLEAHEVLVLHGPPYWPRYYGQLERQNREHRAWLSGWVGDDLAEDVARMIEALNSRWRRRGLCWRTAAELWEARGPLAIDRPRLRDEVDERAERIRRHLEGQEHADDLARRLAIEHVLKQHGLLWREARGWSGRRNPAPESGGLLMLRGRAVDGFEEPRIGLATAFPHLEHRRNGCPCPAASTGGRRSVAERTLGHFELTQAKERRLLISKPGRVLGD